MSLPDAQVWQRSWLYISLRRQQLELRWGGRCRARWTVSTGIAPPCERRGSGGTPRGWHVVRARIGHGQPSGAVFVGRRLTGEVWTPALSAREPGRDWILTRILWLSGLERGRNRLGQVDTMRRFIYIHGCPDDAPMGIPASHGCIRMRNTDVIELFESVRCGVPVWIGESEPDRPPPGRMASAAVSTTAEAAREATKETVA